MPMWRFQEPASMPVVIAYRGFEFAVMDGDESESQQERESTQAALVVEHRTLKQVIVFRSGLGDFGASEV